MPSYVLQVNGTEHTVEAPAEMPLLWVLRDLLGLTGTKYGCGIEVCGACTVIINGQREHSCVFDIGSAVGKTIVTILCDGGARYQSKLFNPAFLRSKKLPVPAWLERKSDLKIPFEKV